VRNRKDRWLGFAQAAAAGLLMAVAVAYATGAGNTRVIAPLLSVCALAVLLTTLARSFGPPPALDDLDRLYRLGRLVEDLARCQHGHLPGQPCRCCGGFSRGNRLLHAGQRLGHDGPGRGIFYPGHVQRTDPAAWRIQPVVVDQACTVDPGSPAAVNLLKDEGTDKP